MTSTELTGSPSLPASSTRTVERALELLSAVCGDRDVTLTECARLARLPASTALRLLRTLESAGFVTRTPAAVYEPGPRLIQIGAATLGRQSVVGLAEPALQRIVARTGESAYLSMLGPGECATYVAVAEGTRAVRHVTWVGRTIPLAGIAVGVVLHGQTPAVGYVAERDHTEPDVTAIAAPVLRAGGGVAAALSLLGPTYRIDDEAMHAYGRIVAEEAHALTAALGGAPDRREAVVQ